MKKIGLYLAGILVPLISACDLQPKITSLPDSVGDFISTRYPTLLADPDMQPEIYNSAVTDYGVYASPELYGSVSQDDYVLYASVNDYVIPPQNDIAPVGEDAVVADASGADDAGATNIATDNGVTAPEAQIEPSDTVYVPTNDYLVVPMYGTANRDVASENIIAVQSGDTLYSLAQRNNTTVAELAKLNELSEPYTLSVGQKLRLATTPDKATNITPVKVTEPAAAPVVTVPVEKTQPTETTRVELREVTVGAGDTLYSLSRRYSVPVNDLAIMNNLSVPFNLYVGQKLKVPDLQNRMASPTVVPVGTSAPATAATVSVATNTTTVKNTTADAATVRAASVGQSGTAGATVTTTTSTATSVAGTVAKGAAAATTKTATTVATTAGASKNTGVKSDNNKNQTTNKTDTTKNAKGKEKISSDPTKKLPQIAARSSSKFSWPVRGTILSHFGAKSNGLFNDGINISATRGTGVKAAENGVVAYAGNEVKGMGNLVIIQHADGWMTVYAHMDSLGVKRGTKVTVGQKIGTVGATGKVEKPQLHFEIRKGTKAYNPVSYLKK